MIRFTVYGVIAEKPHVGQLGRIFRAPCRKKTMRCIEKWMQPFWMGTTSSITTQSSEKIVLRAPAANAKIWCLFFIGHARSPEYCAFEGCIFEQALRCRLYADFDKVSSAFQNCSFRWLHSSYFRW